MANIKITMLELRKMVQYFDLNLSQRSISRKMRISRTSVSVYKRRADSSGKSYKELLLLDDLELCAILQKEEYKPTTDERFSELEPLLPFYMKEMERKHMTYELLWTEYRKVHSRGYGYTRFKALLKTYQKAHTYSYHNTYSPGFECQADFAGDNLYITDKKTGIKTAVVVLCCILPCSSLSFVMALLNATQEHFYYGLSKCMEYFRGTTESVKSDNMRQWVKRSDLHEPTFNEAALQWGLHYDTELTATRPVHPKDKAPVEGLVNKAYQYIYARMRNDVFYSLEALNSRIFELLDEFNSRKMQGCAYSRMERFEEIELPFMKSLPAEPYAFKYSKDFTISGTYHVQIGKEGHFYSIPYEYVHQKARAVYDYQTVEIYVNHKRIALHKRSFSQGGYTTEFTHMPPRHQAYQRSKEYNADYFIRQGKYIGEHTTHVLEVILESKPFIQQSYKSCQGILSLSRKFSPDRLEAACKRTGNTSAVNYQMIKSILERNLDKEDIPQETETSYIPHNENVRGAAAYE